MRLGGGEHAAVLVAELRLAGVEVVVEPVEAREQGVVLVEERGEGVDLPFVLVEVEGGAEVGFGCDGLEAGQTLPCGLQDGGAAFKSRHEFSHPK